MKKRIGIYAGLHFVVDFLCASSMFGEFIQCKSGYWWILIYNFCAFALQMPIGIILDGLEDRYVKRPLSEYAALLGAAITVAGTFSNPVILGIGNAMFHIGGGVSAVREDEDGDYEGAGVGVFVAPGALGVYAGTLLPKAGWYGLCRAGGIGLAGVLAGIVLYHGGKCGKASKGNPKGGGYLSGKDHRLPAACLLVVILRSHIGMAVIFPWKTTVPAGAACVLAVVMGKAAGGFLAARLGIKKAVCSLVLAAVLYVISDLAAAGILALFFFNMTMPMTLYLLVRQYPRAAGFSFGLLTFGLFLGFLPTYLGIGNVLDGRLLGSAGSVLSLLLLYGCVRVCHADVSV